MKNMLQQMFRRLSIKIGQRQSGPTAAAAAVGPAARFPRSYSHTAPRTSSQFIFSRLSDKSEIAPIIARLQQECWDGYVSTGRGCHTLFQLLDTDSSGKISWQEVRFFLENVRESDINPAARKDVLEAASDGDIGFSDFQTWLIKATKVDPGTRNTYASQHYHASIGSAPKPADSVHSWNKQTMSQSLRRMQYAVRGEVVIRADAMAAEGRKIIYTNIGNPHAVGQKPITYYRQVLSLCDLPVECGIANTQVSSAFPTDVVQRAIEMRSAIGAAGTGAYTNSQGIGKFRDDVAHFITARDGHVSFPSNIFLTNGGEYCHHRHEEPEFPLITINIDPWDT
ncbi:hypothetical protein ACHAWF_012351 [Thalassiosira exigua]